MSEFLLIAGRRIPLFCLLATLLIGVAPGVFAQAPSVQDNPYAASVTAKDQSAGASALALRQTLAIVLARVSAQPATSTAGLLDRASSLVQSYGFEVDPASSKLTFRAAFDRSGVDGALRAQGLPVFGVYAGAEEDVVAQVSGIRTPRDYARALNYLKSVPGVKRVGVEQLAGDLAQFRLRIEGGESRLASATGSGNVLRRNGVGYQLVN